MRVALEMAVPSDVAQIERVVARVVATCADLHVPQRQLHFNVPVALTEALSNAILRGNRDDARRTVVIRVAIDEHVFVAEVRDEGDGFDLEACTEDATLAENIAREDGRGLFLMRKLMDRVERFRDGGNVVRLELRRV